MKNNINFSEITENTARILFETNSVHFNTQKPFKLTSGRISPTYINCRRLISFPRARRALIKMAQFVLNSQAGFEQFDSIVGSETSGIPFASWLSEYNSLPLQYIRKKPKNCGLNLSIEGYFNQGDRVLLVDDLASDGISKIKFIKTLRDTGLQVHHIFVIFYYNIFKDSQKIFSELNVKLHYLATWWDILHIANKYHYFDSKTLINVERYLNSPETWPN